MKQLFRLKDDDRTPVKIQDHKYHDVIVNLQELNKIKKITASLFHTMHCPQGNLESVGVEAVRSSAHALEKAKTPASRAELYVIAIPPHSL